MKNAGMYASKTTVQVNETDMQERRQKLLNLNKIRGFDESHPISVSGDARYNNRLESGVGKTPFQPTTQSVYCISENDCMKAQVCLLTRITHVHLRLQVGNFGVQHEFLNLWLSIFVPF
jgi:hypothetical protein